MGFGVIGAGRCKLHHQQYGSSCSGWTFSIWLLVVIFNFSFSIGLWFRADVFQIPQQRQALNVACKRRATPQFVFRHSMKITKFNFKAFFITTIVCGVLTFVTFVAAAARDEGTGGDGIIVKVLEKLFYIFRFPTHTLFFEFMNGYMFFVGLVINCLFYGLVTERIYSFTKEKN